MNLTKIEWAIFLFALLVYLGVFVVVAPFSTDTLADTFKILTPMIIGLFGVYFALMQFRINRNKSKMDLFDKRFSIYETVYKFISSVIDYHVAEYSQLQPRQERLDKEKERYKKIKEQEIDIFTKIELSSIITDINLTKKIREYISLAIKNFHEKETHNFNEIESYIVHRKYSQTIKENDEKLKEIVDTKLRADFEKYFTIK